MAKKQDKPMVRKQQGRAPVAPKASKAPEVATASDMAHRSVGAFEKLIETLSGGVDGLESIGTGRSTVGLQAIESLGEIDRRIAKADTPDEVRAHLDVAEKVERIASADYILTDRLSQRIQSSSGEAVIGSLAFAFLAGGAAAWFTTR